MSSTVGIEVIQECWTRIEPYIDLISLISVSKSCNKLRQLVVDDDSGEIKTSILTVPSIFKDDCPYGPISEHGPRLLNMVHFPSLVKLDIAFPMIPLTNFIRPDENENTFPLALPILARKLEDANNLEIFRIDVDNVIDFEDGGRPQVAYNILKNNLIQCIKQTNKLRHLKISNCGGSVETYGKYSNAFFAAMVPVIQAGILSFETVDVEFGGDPVSSSDNPNALFDFLEAMFSLQNLKMMTVTSTIKSEGRGFFDSLVNVSRSIEEFPSKSLECVRLVVNACGATEEELLPLQLNQIFPLLYKNKALKELVVWLPSSCWNCNNIRELIRYAQVSSSSTLMIGLNGYKDDSGKLFSFMQNVVRDSDLAMLYLSGIGCLSDQYNSIKALGGEVSVDKEENGETICTFVYKRDEEKGDSKTIKAK